VTEPARDHLPDMLEMLEAWLSTHRRSPLDGTISCKICWAMVLEDNSDGHALWHQRSAAGWRWHSPFEVSELDDRQVCDGCRHLLRLHGLRVDTDAVVAVCSDCSCIIWGARWFYKEKVSG
jgi:hypothetical protein